MALSIIIVMAFCLFGIYAFDYYTTDKVTKKNKSQNIGIFILSAFLIRIIFSLFFKGHETDMSCFNAWAEMLKDDGLSEFYVSGAFTDYPPGYMYILYILGFIKGIFKESTILTYTILKLPAIVADILLGLCTYKVCEKHGRDNLKYLLFSFFAFNPSTILNSAIWGQVDSVFTLFVVLMLMALTDGKMILSYFLFGIAIFVKPQALFYAPVLFYGILDNVILNDFSFKKFNKNLFGGICAIAFVFLLALPFGINNVVSQYIATLGSYNYATVNAYNLWAALGMNWSPVNGGINAIGYISIVLIVIASAILFFRKKEKNNYFLTSAFICLSVFMLSVKMHERYAFPVMALLLCSYAISSKKEEMYFYIGISALQFINMYHVLFCYTPETAFDTINVVVCVVTGIVAVLAFVFFVRYLFKGLIKIQPCEAEHKIEKDTRLSKKDFILMSVITLVYSVIALYNLGDYKAPQTFETVDENSTIILELTEKAHVSDINIYLGAQHLDSSRNLNITFYDENDNITYTETVTNGNVFYWNSYETNSVAKYIEISPSDTIYIGEIGIFSDGERLYPSTSSAYVLDEQDVVPVFANYRNGTYFDEIYHARTAYELTNELPVYEWTHPPLGKTLISLGIDIFGMTPFGWRIIGTIFGILMIPILYAFTKKMFGITWISTLSSIVFSFDFMHFSQSRIATIDVYVTFFIMLMYLFMYKYVSEYLGKKTFRKTLVPLGLAGIFMGLGVASKWTGAYAGAGLAVIFFSALYLKYKKGEITTKNILNTVYFCLGAFVIVPVLIYAISYIPFIRANNGGFYDIIQNQIDMFSYHGNTVVSSTHQFSSQWYKWIINYRPIWYYSGTNGALSENISAFGNPVVWIAGLLAFFYCVYDAISNRDKNAMFLVVAYLAQLLPWTFVTRITFIYHYFPCVPFLVLMIAHFVHRMYQKNKVIKPYFIAFTVLSVLLFIMFYPAISGFPVDGDYVREFLRWLPSWQLIG